MPELEWHEKELNTLQCAVPFLFLTAERRNWLSDPYKRHLFSSRLNKNNIFEGLDCELFPKGLMAAFHPSLFYRMSRAQKHFYPPPPPTVSREVTMFTSWVSSCCCSQCQLSETLCLIKKHWCTLKHTYVLQETKSSMFLLFIIIHIRDIIILQNLPIYKNKTIILTNHH